MECGCPLCNGLIKETLTCPACAGLMENSGLVEDYFGPYSPYGIFDDPAEAGLGVQAALGVQAGSGAEQAWCIHLFTCPRCGFDTRVGFPPVVLP